MTLNAMNAKTLCLSAIFIVMLTACSEGPSRQSKADTQKPMTNSTSLTKDIKSATKSNLSKKKYFPVEGTNFLSIDNPKNNIRAFASKRRPHPSMFPKGWNTEGGYPRRRHCGADLYAKRGTPVYAVDDGVVVNYYFFYKGIRGEYWALFVDHGNYTINYGEVVKGLDIEPGDKVKAGERIAEVSGAGMLHFELYDSGISNHIVWVRTNESLSPPNGLRDPTDFLYKLAKDNGVTFEKEG